ncbi:Ferredoxin reductase [Candidatus Burkholderia humilis]|nr:Ferredoxin reductase [Candidatus Burkholderia humilis]
MADLQTVVVIGGGQAAGWIVKTLRKEGFDGRVVTIADEIHLPYERPPLSKAVLAGDADIETVRLVDHDAFAALNVEAWQPECAASIDRDDQAIATARAVLGVCTPYAEIPWFWSDQYDVNLQILGDIPANAQPVVRGDLHARRASLFFFDDANALRGVIAINSPRDLKVAKKWMSQASAVDLAALIDTAKALA